MRAPAHLVQTAAGAGAADNDGDHSDHKEGHPDGDHCAEPGHGVTVEAGVEVVSEDTGLRSMAIFLNPHNLLQHIRATVLVVTVAAAEIRTDPRVDLAPVRNHTQLTLGWNWDSMC